MGRTIPAITQVIFEEVEEVRPLYEGLRRSDQLILDDIFDSVIQHKAALANTGALFPLEVMLILMLLEERKRMDKLHDELFQAVKKIRAEIYSPLQIVNAPLLIEA